MAALTAARDAGRKSATKEADVVAYKVASGVKIYQGALVSVNAAGYLIPARSGTATDVFAGVAYETFDNTSGADGAAQAAAIGVRPKRECRVFKTGTFVFNKASAAQTDLGVEYYAADDNTLTATSTNNQLVGVAVGAETVTGAASTTTLRIRIDGYAK